MQFIEVRHSRLSEVPATKEEIATLTQRSVFRGYRFLPIVMAVGLLVFSTTRADTDGNPAEQIRARLCPMLDSLTQASVSMAKQDRATASTQIGLTISLADSLSSTIESPEMAGVRGKKAKALLKGSKSAKASLNVAKRAKGLLKGVSRFKGRLARAKLLLDEPAVADPIALQGMLTAVADGQRLRKLMLSIPASDTIIMLREAATRGVALHYSGDVVCFHVDALNDNGTPSCDPADVSVAVLGGDPADSVVMGPPSLNSPTDFCLTMGPDAGTVRVTVTMCGQSNSVLLYNYGTPKKAGRAIDAPSDLTATTGSIDTIQLTWSYNSSDAEGFKIERSASGDGPWALIGSTDNNTTTYADAGLDESASYYYRVRAYNAKGYSAYSDLVQAGTPVKWDNTPPSTPTGLDSLSVSGSQIDLIWDPSTDPSGSGVQNYEVYRDGVLIGTTPNTTYSCVNLTPETQYCFTVVAVDKMNNASAESGSSCLSTLSLSAAAPVDSLPPSIPNGLTVFSSSATQVTMHWNAATDLGGSGLAGYRVYRNGALVASTSATTYADSGLSAGSQYCYSIVAYDNAGNSSSPSAQACATTPSTGTPGSGAVPAEEFVGPFDSWADLQDDYGAVGNGLADDTAALQAALNDLGKSGRAAVLYVPAGTYRITQTVTLLARENVSILGEHPDVTRWKWDGASGGVLLHIDGVNHSRFDRITFDGAGKAGVLIDQSLTGYGQGQHFDSGNEYADDVFQDASIGIRAGNYDLGAAESSVLRCQFRRHSTAGIILKNFNALDWFIWYCTFDDNYDGVSNNPGAGSFHVFGSLFHRSTNADLDIANTGLFSFRYNTSIGSKRFFNTAYTGGNGAQITIQGNTIVDTTADDAINIGTMGPILLVDNIIASRVGATGPAVKQNCYDSPDLTAVGNRFTVLNPLSVSGSSTPRFLNVDNQTVARAALNLAEPTLPDVRENYDRPVFEVAPGASAATIQAAINQAAALNGQRPVVHLPQGSYNIMQTLVVPANADLQIVGDGGVTGLGWGGPQGTTPVFRLAGPSRAVLRDFAINTFGKGAGILVENADQAGARIFAEQAFLTRGLTANLLVDQLDRATVELHDLYQSQTSIAPAATGTGVKVVGGPNAASGNPQGGKVSVFAGAASNNHLSFDVINGGRLLVNDVWYEGSGASTFAHVANNSLFTLTGSRLALPQTGYSVRIDDLKGQATILTSQPDAPVGVFGTGTGTVWVNGNESHGPSSYFSLGAPATLGVFTNNRWYDPATGSRSVANQGNADNNLVTALLAHLRSERPLAEPTVLPAGVTDLRLYRVFIDAATTGLRLQP